jgi:hypothetical protein
MNAKLLASILVVGTLFTATSASAQRQTARGNTGSTNIQNNPFTFNISNVGSPPIQLNNQNFQLINDNTGNSGKQSNVANAPVKQSMKTVTAPTTVIVQPAPVVVAPAPKAPKLGWGKPRSCGKWGC